MISVSKFIMRKESTRDHVDLLMLSRHWPLVYAVDMACDVVAHIEVSNLNSPMQCGERNKDVFSSPSEESHQR